MGLYQKSAMYKGPSKIELASERPLLVLHPFLLLHAHGSLRLLWDGCFPNSNGSEQWLTPYSSYVAASLKSYATRGEDLSGEVSLTARTTVRAGTHVGRNDPGGYFIHSALFCMWRNV